MLVCAGACVCVCMRVYELRIVSRDKILRFKNTVIIIIYLWPSPSLSFSLSLSVCLSVFLSLCVSVSVCLSVCLTPPPPRLSRVGISALQTGMHSQADYSDTVTDRYALTGRLQRYSDRQVCTHRQTTAIQ